MSAENFASVLQIFASLLLGLSAQFGITAGWGGLLVFKSRAWRLLNGVGWLCLLLGGVAQLKAN